MGTGEKVRTILISPDGGTSSTNFSVVFTLVLRPMSMPEIQIISLFFFVKTSNSMK